MVYEHTKVSEGGYYVFCNNFCWHMNLPKEAIEFYISTPARLLFTVIVQSYLAKVVSFGSLPDSRIEKTMVKLNKFS